MFAQFFATVSNFFSTEKFRLLAIFILCLLINISSNQSIFLTGSAQQIPIIFIGTFTIAAITCLIWAFCRSWTLIFLGFLLVVQLPQTIMLMLFEARLTPFVISAMLDAAPAESAAYVNSTTILLGVVAILFVLGILFALKKLFQKFTSKKKYLLAFSTFSLLSLGSFLISLPLDYEDEIPLGSIWFYNQPAQILQNYSKAITYNTETIQLLDKLPSPAKFESNYPYENCQDKLTIIIHIGESTRADMLSINGYKRKTTPFLENYPYLVNFPSCVSVAGDTCLAQISILTGGEKALTADHGSILDLIRKHKFQLSTFSGQLSSMNIKYDMVFKKLTSCTQHRYFSPGLMPSILPQIEEILSKNGKKNTCLVINNEGNHTPFANFDEKNAPFQPVCTTFENPKLNSQKIINAYDNCTVLLDSFIEKLTTKTLQGRPFLYIYIGDHGEFLGHDGLWGRGALGDSKTPYHETTGCLVPFFVMWSPELLEQYPSKAKLLKNLAANQKITTCHAHFFHTLLGLLEISSPCYKADFDLSATAAKSYEGPQPSK